MSVWGTYTFLMRPMRNETGAIEAITFGRFIAVREGSEYDDTVDSTPRIAAEATKPYAGRRVENRAVTGSRSPLESATVDSEFVQCSGVGRPS